MFREISYELIGLNKIYIEAKFSTDPVDSIVRLSPLLAKLSRDNLEKLLALYEDNNCYDEAKEWRELYANIKNTPIVYERFLEICRQEKAFLKSLDSGELRIQIASMAAPYAIADGDLDSVVARLSK